MKLIKKDEKNWDFDFSIYDREEKKEERILNSRKIKRPKVTVRRSVYSPALMELENLTALKLQISENGIKVAAYSQEIKDLWNFYGCLNEYWARIYDVFGELAIEEIEEYKEVIERKLINAEKTGTLDFNIHKILLKMRDKIYLLAQRVNLGISTEKMYGTSSKAKSGMTE